mgnify:CR=1 FL=1
MWTQDQFDALQARYPWLSEEPGAPPMPSEEDDCCVGGAFMRACDPYAAGFPISRWLADQLRAVGVKAEHAYLAAQNIISAYDNGRVTDSWAYLRATIVAPTE